jgi:hypothetical protein
MLHLNPSPLTSPTPPLPEGEEGRKKALSELPFSPLSLGEREGRGSEGSGGVTMLQPSKSAESGRIV